jgi:hypothetical protein
MGPERDDGTDAEDGPFEGQPAASLKAVLDRRWDRISQSSEGRD